MDDIIEKQMKYLGEGSFLKKEHLQKLPHGIFVVTDFFSLTEALVWKLLLRNYDVIAHLIIDEKDDPYDGVVCLMIFGLTSNMPYVLHSIP